MPPELSKRMPLNTFVSSLLTADFTAPTASAKSSARMAHSEPSPISENPGKSPGSSAFMEKTVLPHVTVHPSPSASMETAALSSIPTYFCSWLKPTSALPCSSTSAGNSTKVEDCMSVVSSDIVSLASMSTHWSAVMPPLPTVEDTALSASCSSDFAIVSLIDGYLLSYRTASGRLPLPPPT